jgi:hypothetical protein
MKIKRFEFTPILGWSASRYDIFSEKAGFTIRLILSGW